MTRPITSRQTSSTTACIRSNWQSAQDERNAIGRRSAGSCRHIARFTVMTARAVMRRVQLHRADWERPGNAGDRRGRGPRTVAYHGHFLHLEAGNYHYKKPRSTHIIEGMLEGRQPKKCKTPDCTSINSPVSGVQVLRTRR